MVWEIYILSLAIAVFLLIPAGLKWMLDKKVFIPVLLIIAFFTALILDFASGIYPMNIFVVLLLQIFMILTLSGALLLWRFYRDPERLPPDDKNAILSPADGKVIYVKKINEGQAPIFSKKGKKYSLNDFIQSKIFYNGGYLVGISMNFLDVHVNRAPIGGKISLMRHIKGRFISLRHKEAVVENERLLTVIDTGEFKLGIVQIASRLVRRIIPFLSEGEAVDKGDRIGMIRFGSQVDIIIPNLPNLQIIVLPEMKMTAGISIIASFD